MLIVMNMENGRITHSLVAAETESHMPSPHVPLALFIPQPRLQEVSFPPRAVCPPPSLAVIDVSLSAFD
ncbi:MAG: hypothetical protein FWH56_04165 [Betaproteobacteria bacterium]|nr:hypothetical protein [Betaproteobacteria bacterium]